MVPRAVLACKLLEGWSAWRRGVGLPSRIALAGRRVDAVGRRGVELGRGGEACGDRLLEALSEPTGISGQEGVGVSVTGGGSVWVTGGGTRVGDGKGVV